MSSFDIKIPDKMVLGLCECLAGVLLVVAPIPGSTVVGATLIGDGIRRVGDAVEVQSKLNAENKPVNPPNPILK